MSTRRRRSDGFARRALVAALLLVPSAIQAAAVGTKTLARLHDPGIVRTALLAELSARETAGYRLYAVRQGRLEPTPFQFDARDADGELVLSEAGGETEFTFDDDDELVFMAKDTGDRAA